MLGRFLKWLSGRWGSSHNPSSAKPIGLPLVTLEEGKLDDYAPLRETDHSALFVQDLDPDSPKVSSAPPTADNGAAPPEIEPSFICREPLLDSSGHMSGYEFMLRKSPTNKA